MGRYLHDLRHMLCLDPPVCLLMAWLPEVLKWWHCSFSAFGELNCGQMRSRIQTDWSMCCKWKMEKLALPLQLSGTTAKLQMAMLNLGNLPTAGGVDRAGKEMVLASRLQWPWSHEAALLGGGEFGRPEAAFNSPVMGIHSTTFSSMLCYWPDATSSRSMEKFSSIQLVPRAKKISGLLLWKVFVAFIDTSAPPATLFWLLSGLCWILLRIPLPPGYPLNSYKISGSLAAIFFVY